jgi:hypothetical protein
MSWFQGLSDVILLLTRKPEEIAIARQWKQKCVSPATKGELLDNQNPFFLISFLFATCINTFGKYCVGMREEKKIETCRRVLISTPLYQAGAGTFVT